MNERQSKLLAAIIDQFIATATPVGSHHLLEAGMFDVSGATVRNEMRFLSEEGFLIQPHVSAGRIPTAKGYRLYVQQYMQPSKHEVRVRKRFQELQNQYLQRKDQERAYYAVGLLSHMVPDVAFATVPHKDRVYYLGLSNVFRQPEFQADPRLATGVAEVLEEQLTATLGRLTIDDSVQYYIGEEHVLPQIQSCSLMVTQYKLREYEGVIGILGPMRMDYAYNTVALQLVANLLRSGA